MDRPVLSGCDDGSVGDVVEVRWVGVGAGEIGAEVAAG